MKVLVLLPIRNRPSVGGSALSPSLPTPALPTHSPLWSFTRSCIPANPESTISWTAFRSSGRSCPAGLFGVRDMVVCSFVSAVNVGGGRAQMLRAVMSP